MKNLLQLATLFCVCLVVSCKSINDAYDYQSDSIPYDIHAAQSYGSKVSIDGNHLTWNTGDKIGFFVSGGLQSNMIFTNTTENSFSGIIKRTGSECANVSYYAYYPYSCSQETSGTLVSGILPTEQKAPFHPEADFIVADSIDDRYDENNMPALNFVFKNHLFSILKITITNSDSTLQNERLLGVDIISDSTPLSGNFSFDITNPQSTLEFSESQTMVRSSFEDNGPVIGCGAQHTIYAVVRNISNDNITIRVRTSKRTGNVHSSRTITTNSGQITNLAPIDISSLEDVQMVKTLVYWGDSIASSNIIVWLQQLLGDGWRVIGGGIRGATALSIASRQGGIQLLTGASQIVIPGNHTSSTKLDKFYVNCTNDSVAPIGTYSVSTQYWVDVDKDTYCNPASPLVNDFIVNGTMCRMTSYNKGIYISRVEDGEEVIIPANSPVITFAAREYRDADVIVTYMGTNQRDLISDEQLANCYQAMMDYSSSQKHIVVGFHFDIINTKDCTYWSESYRDYFKSRFGDKYLDLRTIGSANAERLCVETGQHSSASEMSGEDKYYVGLGEWPVSWTGSRRNDIHPTIWGHRAIAEMVYEKMDTLGYLN